MNKPFSFFSTPRLNAVIMLILTAFLFSCGQHGTSKDQYNKAGIQNDTSAPQNNDSVATKIMGGVIKSDTLKTADLPASITYKGKAVKIMSWKDKLGENLLLLTETGEFASKDSAEYQDNRDAELHVYHYVKTAAVWQKIASVNDQISSCPVDIVTSFVPGALFITDLDNNGIAECTFAYLLTCTGGVDNKVMKLIMLENKNKYVIRGTTTVNVGEKIPGTMKYDAGIPERFKVFMIEKWKAFETEHNQ